MKKNSRKIIISLLIVTIFFVVVLTPLSSISFLGNDSGTVYAGPISNTISLGDTLLRSKIASETNEFLESTASWIGSLFLSFTGWILGLSGVLLNTSLTYTVVEMSKRISDLSTLTDAWRAFRDLANIGFIFIILYVAIATILQLDNVNTKRLMVHVIIIALLLNFSLFFTQVIIDTSNILATHFHQSMSQAGGENGIAGAFMQKLNLQSIYDPSATDTSIGSINILLIGILGSVLFLVVAFVFGAMSILLISRFVILIFLMIISPLAFMSMALPKGNLAKKFLRILISQSFFAPIMLAFLWVTLTILGGMFPEGGTGGSLVDLLPTNISGENIAESKIIIILNFIVVIGMAIFSLIAAKQLGAHGANGAVRLGGKWARKAGRGAMAPGRWARYGAGVTARTALNASRFEEPGKEHTFGKYKFRRPALSLRNAYEKAGKTERWNRPVHKAVKEATLGKLLRAKIGGKSALKSHEELEKLRAVRESIKTTDTMKGDVRKIQAEKKEIKENKDYSADEKTELLQKSDDKLNDVMTRIPDLAFIDLLSKKDFFDPDIMKNASNSQYQKLMDSDRLTYDEKTKATEARFAWIDAEIQAINDPDQPEKKEFSQRVKDKLKDNTSVTELEHINERMPEMLSKPILWASIKTSVMKDFKKSDKLSTARKKEIKELVYSDIIEAGKEERPIDNKTGKVDEVELEKQRKKMGIHFENFGASDLADAPSSAITPLYMDSVNINTLKGFSGERGGEKKKLIKHMLEMEQKGILSHQNKQVIAWLSSGEEKAEAFFDLRELESELEVGAKKTGKEWKDVDRTNYKKKKKTKSEPHINTKPKTVNRSSGGAEPYGVKKPTMRAYPQPKPDAQTNTNPE